MAGVTAAAMSEHAYAVSVLASRRNGTLYIGVANNLSLRVHQHRSAKDSVFTTKYGVNLLVWYEYYSDVNEAIAREKQLKKMGKKMEAQIDRGLQSHLGRFIRQPQSMKTPPVIPAQAGLPDRRSGVV
jgi:putative endonuclease